MDHYLDDFITWGPVGSEECKGALEVICRTCAELGVPLTIEKLEGPAAQLTFLGIEIDTAVGVLPLPPNADGTPAVVTPEVLQAPAPVPHWLPATCL